jgi:hypothetical protein
MVNAGKLRKTILIVALCLGYNGAFAQKFLRITSAKFGKTKITEIENHSFVRYRVKGSFFGKRGTVVDMRDSTLFFDNSDAVKLGSLKGIGMRSEAHFPRTLQHLFFYGGFGLIPLSVINNVITGQEVVITPGLVYVSATALAAGFLTMWLRNKRIHTGNNKVLQIMERENYLPEAGPVPRKDD